MKTTKDDFIKDVVRPETPRQRRGEILFFVSDRQDGKFIRILYPDAITPVEKKYDGDPKDGREVLMRVIASEVAERKKNDNQYKAKVQDKVEEFRREKLRNYYESLRVCKAQDVSKIDLGETPVISVADAICLKPFILGEHAKGNLVYFDGCRIIGVSAGKYTNQAEVVILKNYRVEVETLPFQSLLTVGGKSEYVISADLREGETETVINVRLSGIDFPPSFEITLSESGAQFVPKTSFGTPVYSSDGDSWLEAAKTTVRIINAWKETK